MRERDTTDPLAWTRIAVADCYCIDDLVVDARTCRVTRDGCELDVGGLSFELLLVLARAAPELVSIDGLIEHVWQGAVVSPETVIQRVRLLRQALGERADDPRYIRSLRGRGYRMVAVVTATAAPQLTPGVFALPPVASASDVASNVRPIKPPHGTRAWIATILVVAIPLGAVGAWWTLGRHAAQTATAAAVGQEVARAPRTSLAVLPFVNLTGDAAKDYLGDGMAEEVINQLTRLPSLKVPARTSSFAYKGRGTDIRQIAKDLGVATVLEGSVREAGARIRITAQLIDARTGLHIWSHTYDERFTDLFKLQDDLANAIVQALQVNLNGTAITTTWQLPPTQNVEAYDLDLQGEALLERSTVQSIRRALDYFQQSTDRDRNFVRAYADIAGARYLLAGPFGQQPIENLDKAHSAALRALTLNASSSEAHMVLAAVGLSRGDWLEAAAQSRMGLSLNSGDGGVHEAQGALLDNAGHLGEALEEQRRAQALAPTSPSVALNTAIAYLLLGRDVEALKSARVAADLGWSDSALSFVREESALHAGRYADATAAALAMLDVQVPDQARTAAIIKRVYAALADPRTRALAMRARAQLYPQSREVEASAAMVADVRPCLQSSYMYALLGERDIAYDLANQCLDSKAPGGIAEGPLARLWTPELHAFRQDPRFQALATRLGLMAYWQKYGPPDNCELKANRLICS